MKPRPSRYNGAILKKLVFFLRKVELFLLQLGCSKEEERLRGVGSFTAAGGKLCLLGNGLWLPYRRLLLFVNGLWLTYRRPTSKGTVLKPCNGTVLKLTTVQFANGLRP